MLDVLKILDEILNFLKDKVEKDPIRKDYYDFLLQKYTQLKLSIVQKNDDVIKELIYWNKYFAPRIIYEGAFNSEESKIMINKAEELNRLFNIENN